MMNSQPVMGRKSSRSPLNPVDLETFRLNVGSRGDVCSHHKGLSLARKKSLSRLTGLTGKSGTSNQRDISPRRSGNNKKLEIPQLKSTDKEDSVYERKFQTQMSSSCKEDEGGIPNDNPWGKYSPFTRITYLEEVFVSTNPGVSENVTD